MTIDAHNFYPPNQIDHLNDLAFENCYRVIAQHTSTNFFVSTVWLGYDRIYGNKLETIVCRRPVTMFKEHDHHVYRYYSLETAVANHRYFVRKNKNLDKALEKIAQLNFTIETRLQTIEEES